MLLALFACAPDAPAPADDTAVSAPEATASDGLFAVTVADTWEGDCEFEDSATALDPEQEWTFDPRGDVLIVYQGFWDVLSCALDGVAFDCDNGSYEENRMQITRRVEGAFPAEDTVEGAYVIALDCGGAGCDTLQDLYGRRLDFPCRSEAPFVGERR